MFTPARHPLLLIWPYLLQAVCPVNDHKTSHSQLVFLCVVKCIAEMFNVFVSCISVIRLCGLIVTSCIFLIF